MYVTISLFLSLSYLLVSHVRPFTFQVPLFHSPFFFFRLSGILQRASSCEANTRPRDRHHQRSRFRRRFLFPLVRRWWQFRGMSHRGAASRTNRSLVLVVLEKTSLCFFFIMVFFFGSFLLSFTFFFLFSHHRSVLFFEFCYSRVRLAGVETEKS